MNTKLITLECTLFHISTITNSTHDVIYDPPLKRSSYRKQFITAENNSCINDFRYKEICYLNN